MSDFWQLFLLIVIAIFGVFLIRIMTRGALPLVG